MVCDDPKSKVSHLLLLQLRQDHLNGVYRFSVNLVFAFILEFFLSLSQKYSSNSNNNELYLLKGALSFFVLFSYPFMFSLSLIIIFFLVLWCLI